MEGWSIVTLNVTMRPFVEIFMNFKKLQNGEL